MAALMQHAVATASPVRPAYNGRNGQGRAGTTSPALLPALLQERAVNSVLNNRVRRGRQEQRQQQQRSGPRRRVSAFRHHFAGSRSRLLDGSHCSTNACDRAASVDVGDIEPVERPKVADEMSVLVQNLRKRSSASVSPLRMRRNKSSRAPSSDIRSRPSTPDGYDSILWHALPKDILSSVSAEAVRATDKAETWRSEHWAQLGDLRQGRRNRQNAAPKYSAHANTSEWSGRSGALDSAYEFRRSLSRLTRVQKAQKAQAARETAEYKRLRNAFPGEQRPNSGAFNTMGQLQREQQRHEANMKMAHASLSECRDAIDAHGEEQFNWWIARQNDFEQERQRLRELDRSLRLSMHKAQQLDRSRHSTMQRADSVSPIPQRKQLHRRK